MRNRAAIARSYLPISRTPPIRDPAQNASTEERCAKPARASGGSRGSPRFETWLASLARVASWQTMAAANNAEWCDLVCGTHGAQTRFDEGAWTSRTRTPARGPGAVTWSLIHRLPICQPGSTRRSAARSRTASPHWT
jgi:hypothetical protein